MPFTVIKLHNGILNHIFEKFSVITHTVQQWLVSAITHTVQQWLVSAITHTVQQWLVSAITHTVQQWHVSAITHTVQQWLVKNRVTSNCGITIERKVDTLYSHKTLRTSFTRAQYILKMNAFYCKIKSLAIVMGPFIVRARSYSKHMH